MQLLLRQLIFFYLCSLSFSCATISSDVKHSEWMQIKDERKKVPSVLDNAEVEVLCEPVSSAKIRFTERFDVYCNEMKKSIQLFSKYFLGNGIHNLVIKIEILPFENPSMWLNTPYSIMFFPSIDENGKVVVSWYGFDNNKDNKKIIYSKYLNFDRYAFFWSFIGFGQYDLIKRVYEDRWYEGEKFGFNLIGISYSAEFAIILNRRMIQDVIDGKVSLVNDSSK